MIEYPLKHQRLIELGVFNRLQDTRDPMSLYDVKFPADSRIWEHVTRNRVVEILPFAMTGAGDIWGYCCTKLPHAPVTCFYHDDAIAEEVALDIEHFFVLQLIHDAIYGTSEEHPGVPQGWT